MSKPRSRRTAPSPARRPSARQRTNLRGLAVEPLEPRELLATLVVNTNLDPSDPTGNALSLRQAILVSDGLLAVSALTAAQQAQITGPLSTNAPNVIHFALTGGTTIALQSQLPAITSPLAVDGYSQSGTAINPTSAADYDVAVATVRIDGTAASAATPGVAVDGLDIVSSNCIIDGLIVTGFSGVGVSISDAPSGARSRGNWLWGDFIGTLPDPSLGHDFPTTASLSNAIAGVKVTSSNNTIGGNDPGLRNVIDNNGVGLILATPTGTGSIVENNYVLDNKTVGVLVTSSNNTIGQQTAGGGNIVSGNGTVGILITGDDPGVTGVARGTNVQGNGVFGNEVGTDVGLLNTPLSRGVRPRIAVTQQQSGVVIQDSPANSIGSTIAAGKNVIAGNSADGLDILGASSVANRVLGNWVGFNLAGTALPNYSNFLQNLTFQPNQNGIVVAASGNQIGGVDLGSGNTISNNRNHGVWLTGPGATGNTVLGNVIGLTPTGDVAIGNAFDGVRVDAGASGNTIGGTTPAARNTISGNDNGVDVVGPTSTGNAVLGNFIGTGSDGLTDLGNAVDGVVLDNAPNNVVGGTTAGAGNVISGNNRGVVITGSGVLPDPTNDTVQGNFIGTDLTGKAYTPNEIDGVLVTLGASGNTIGGTSPGAGNTIANNIGAGVFLDTGVGNAVRSNSIFNNFGGGIAVNQGDTRLPAPTLALAVPNGTATSIQGSVSLPADPNTQVTVEFFSTPTNSAQGRTPIGSVTVTTDNSGNAQFAQSVPVSVAASQWVTATVTDAGGNTSNFSPTVQAVPVAFQFSPATYTAGEASGTVMATVTRTGNTNAPATVDFTVGGGTAVAGVDYTSASGTLVFATGVTSITFPAVSLIDAKKIGGSQTLNLTLSNPTNGASLGVASVAGLTILDNDQPAVGLGAGVISVNESAGGVQFTVTRNSPIGAATVQYATADGTALAGVNYLNTAGTLTFNPGETSKVVTVPVLDDGVVTGPLTFTLALSNPTNMALGGTSVATARVVNTDVAGGAPTPVSYTITVNTNLDTVDLTGGTVSLREAIEISDHTLALSKLSFAARNFVSVSPVLPATGNAPAVPNTINFAIPGSGIQTIALASALPAVTAPVLINGYSQPGSSISAVDKTEVDVNGALVRIDGSGVGAAGVDGLAIQTSNCEVNGLIVTGFSGAGISISLPGSQGNWLWGNFLGALPDPTNGKYFEVDPQAAATFSQPQLGNLGAGLRITASNNRIGGNTPGLPNVMANNGYDSAGNSASGVGILIDAGGTGNLIQGNVVVNNAAQGVLVHSSNNTIGEALAGGGNVIGGNGGQGVEITNGATGVDVQGNQLLGNFIGTDLGSVDGKVKKGTVRFPNKAQGVLIENSPKNTIGGYLDSARNVIGSNLLDGVEVDGALSIGNRILNNYIGFNQVGGTIALLPNQNGVTITSAGNFVGDASGTGGNTISNNRNHGVYLVGAGATGNTVAGNLIGLNPGGASAFPNAFDGVRVDNAPNNVIGGTTVAARNTISANNNGVYLVGPGASGNQVLGNFIGTMADGVTALGNAVDGVVLDNAPNNQIGGLNTTTPTAATLGNVISGNNRGIRITGAVSTENLIQGNFVGTDLTAKVDLANSIDGVLVTAQAPNNTIGGLLAGAGNTIGFDAGKGVNLDSGAGNAVLGNGIFSNVASGQFVPGGIYLNAASNADNVQPAPVLTAVVPNGPSTNVQGTLTAAPNTAYTLQFFSSPARDRTGYGQGQTLVLTAPVTTNASGSVAFALNLPAGISSGQWLTATATNLVDPTNLASPVGNTSAFSNAVVAVPVSLQLGASSYNTNEAAGVVSVTVTRSGGLGGTVSVNYNVDGGTATQGVDYTATTGTLSFFPTDPVVNGVVTKTFSIPILDPHKVGGSVTANVTLGSPTNGATVGPQVTAVLTIQDTDPPAAGFAPGPYTFYGPGVAYVTVTRNTPTGAATVHYATNDGTGVAGVNYVAASGTLTFNPGETSKVIPVMILDDNQSHAAPLTFGLTLSQPSGFALGPNSAVTLTDVTSNAAGVFQLATATTVAAPGATVAAVTVVRTGGKTGAVTVNYATGGGNARPGVDYKPVSGTLSFAPGETSKVVYVPLLNTSAPGASPNFIFGLGVPTGGSTLGPQMNTLVTVLHPAPISQGTSNNAPATVTEVLPLAGATGFSALVITFNKPMDPTRATNPANYAISLNGRSIPVARVGYDPSAVHAVVYLSAPVPYGAFARLDVKGLIDTTGILLDGSGTGHNPGSPYSALIGEGSRLVYADRTGDTVGLTLSGPGLIALRRGLDGEAQELRFVGTAPNLSTLTGVVVPRAGTPGTTSIPSITGAAGVKIRLASPPFYLGGITAMAVDALAVSGGLKARR